MQCRISVTKVYVLRLELREVNAIKLVHEFRAATFDCNSGQCIVELLLTLIHNRYYEMC